MEIPKPPPPQTLALALTSFSSAGLLCGRGHAADTSPSSSNSGTWNSEAESRSLLTAGSVTRQAFGTKAGNTGSSLAPWRQNDDKICVKYAFYLQHFYLDFLYMFMSLCVWRPGKNFKTMSFLGHPIHLVFEMESLNGLKLTK